MSSTTTRSTMPPDPKKPNPPEPKADPPGPKHPNKVVLTYGGPDWDDKPNKVQDFTPAANNFTIDIGNGNILTIAWDESEVVQ
jgi:hypothetical protein